MYFDIYDILRAFSFFFFPLLLLLFLYSRSNKRLIWLTIPITLVVSWICWWAGSPSAESMIGVVYFLFPVQTLVVSGLTALAAFIKSKQSNEKTAQKKRKEKIVIVVMAAVICIAAAGNSTYMALYEPPEVDYELLAQEAELRCREAFAELTQIKPEDIESIEGTYEIDMERLDCGENKTFLADLEYLKDYETPAMYPYTRQGNIDITLKNGADITLYRQKDDIFGTHYEDITPYDKKDDIFDAYYNNSIWVFVRIPQLSEGE